MLNSKKNLIAYWPTSMKQSEKQLAIVEIADLQAMAKEKDLEKLSKQLTELMEKKLGYRVSEQAAQGMRLLVEDLAKL